MTAAALGNDLESRVVFCLSLLAAILVGQTIRFSLSASAALAAAKQSEIERVHLENRQLAARDVHDIIAHTMTIMTMNIGAARLSLLGDEPDAAIQALAAAEQASRESGRRIRQVVSMLRDKSVDVTRAPDLSTVVDSFRDAGLHLETLGLDALDEISEHARSVIVAVVSESFTNALRYGGGNASVRIGKDATEVTVTITNPIAPRDRLYEIGHGVRGMIERVEDVGGSLHAGQEGDVWVVKFTVPRSRA